MIGAPAIIVLNRVALPTALRLVEALPGATLHCSSDEVFHTAGEAPLPLAGEPNHFDRNRGSEAPLPLAGEGGARRSSSDGGRVRVVGAQAKRAAMLKSRARQLRVRMTDAERRLWSALRGRRLGTYKFRRQCRMGPYILDFACLAQRLAVEADGGQHADSLRDRRRDAWLGRRGWRVLRFSNNEILANPRGVQDVILRALEARRAGASADTHPHPPDPDGSGPSLSRKRERGLWPAKSETPVTHSRMEEGVRYTNNFSLQEDLIHKIDKVPSHLRCLYREGTPILALCAAGIVIRALAPVLADKRSEPPALAIAPDGSAVIPLLGGHHGANDLARQVGEILGVAPAITTASDLAFGVALDDPPPGWRLANPEHFKPFMAALLDGAAVRLRGAAPWLEKSDLPFADHAPLEILVTTETAAGSETRLVLHPQSVAIGVGCERGAEPAEVIELVTRTLAEAGQSPLAIAGVFSLDLKADEPAVHAVADHLCVPARFFDAETLEALTPRLANPSDLVFREVGCHGVAEAAALAAAGDTATLLIEKRKSARATCALAAAPSPIDAEAVGRPQGWLAIVGLGPGSPDWRTPEAERLLRQASDLVGHDLYLDLLDDLSTGKTRHSSPMGEEEARARLALDLAAAGRQVVLVSSGDPGVYAMATLVFALLETDGREAWRRLPIQVTPGVTALHAAAARVGAPTGHDFCAISLSDLLTPWEVIARRVEAAAAADFVIGFFNPVSRRRDWQLDRARDILLKHRAKETPVILARAVGREEESVQVIPLADLSADKADMLTIVIVGASTTRTVPRAGGVWVYTPRGYDCEPKP